MRPYETLRKLRIAICVGLIIVVVTVSLPPIRGPIVCWTQWWCRHGLTKVSVAGHTEYAGVTGTDRFRPDFWHVMDMLKQENAYATKGGPGTYITVALAGPLSDSEPRALQRIEGAISGQYAANHSGLVGDRPRIRLVLANMDSSEGHWKLVADRLVDKVRGDEHLEAVAGMGLSQAETVDAMNELRAQHVATVGDMMTADTINQRTYPPFVRVGPDTGQQLDVLGQHLRPRLAQHKAMLVVYSKRTDMYTSALNADFQRYLGGPWRAGGAVIAPFGENPGNEFPQIVKILCGARGIDTVYYAGRAADLPLFLTDLGTRPGCAPGTITVVSTSDTTRLLVNTAPNRQASQALRNTDRPIDLIFTPLADSAFLTNNPESHQQITALRGLFDTLGFARADLDAGWSIMAHDAILTIAQAVRSAAGDAGRIPPPQSVAEQLGLMSTPSTAVPGASGPIRLDQATGNRYDLRIPVLRFVPGGQPKVLGAYTPKNP